MQAAYHTYRTLSRDLIVYPAAAVTIIFYLLDSAKDLVLGIPFSLYSTFVIEQKHGFNKQTLGLFFMDVIKSVGSLPACP